MAHRARDARAVEVDQVEADAPLTLARAAPGGDDGEVGDITVEDGRPLDDVDVLPGVYGRDPLYVFEGGDVREFDFAPQVGGGAHGAASDGAILSPMPGKVVSVAVSAGQSVTKGQTLLVLEAMKMEHALAAPFDVIFMDVMLPDMTGLVATKRIRDEEARCGWKRTPIIALTAHAMNGDEQRCLDAGMDGYVSKPLKPAELFAAIQRVVVVVDTPSRVA